MSMTKDPKKDGDGRAPEPEKPALTIDIVVPKEKRNTADPDYLEKPDDEKPAKRTPCISGMACRRRRPDS